MTASKDIGQYGMTILRVSTGRRRKKQMTSTKKANTGFGGSSGISGCSIFLHLQECELLRRSHRVNEEHFLGCYTYLTTLPPVCIFHTHSLWPLQECTGRAIIATSLSCILIV